MLFICFASVSYTNTKLDTSCNLQSDWDTTTGRLLNGYVMRVQRKMSFPRTQRYVAKFRNRTESRQFCGCQLVLLSTKLHRLVSVKCLSLGQSKKCDIPITSKECLIALFQLSNKKSPGLDDFSVEFYKTFWKYLEDLFLKNINFLFVQRRLSNSQYKGLITLIPEPGRDNLERLQL